MKFRTYASAAVVGALISASAAGAGAQGMMSKHASAVDVSFATAAAKGGMAEVQQAKLALKKSKNPTVIAFAQRMVTDHGKMNDQLKAIAQAQNIMLPASVGADNASAYAKLSSLSGSAFDRAYITGQGPAHEQTATLMRSEIDHGSDPQLVALAKKALPIVESHLSMDKKDVSMMGSMSKSSM